MLIRIRFKFGLRRSNKKIATIINDQGPKKVESEIVEKDRKRQSHFQLEFDH